ncbi:FAR-17a/AIG1-like protein [Glomus cerebriforme]|uniref:FAR-17a/AIG1-like protein n=1 Tax=Glomus cerebriforme TaxID=658196 RepID=A0A397S2U5_9GLOM|nr:FAR-17a/AIG1-like protein [Glomus cerebriforme]RIA93835.1 FAR-17a/AIG1-like protein [Glomus cerebriforme]
MSKIYQLVLHALGIASFSYSFSILHSLSKGESFFFSIHVISFLKNWFMVIAVPLEGLISILYWGILIYDEKLLFDKPRLPILIDLGFHLIPAICLWTDFLFFTKEFRKSHSHIFYLLLFAFSYAVWIQFYFIKFGTWPYPLLSKLESQQRVGFYFACFALCTGIYHMGAFVHTIFNKSLPVPTKQKDKAL